MKHPDVFSSLYIMSPCCLSLMGSGSSNPERQRAMESAEKELESVKTLADAAGLSFFAKARLASAAAWSPDPKNPPLYLDLPRKHGEPQPDVIAKWAANALEFLATGILGVLAQDTGKIGMLLAIWNVRAARDLAWDFTDHLRSLTGIARDSALAAQDQLTGVLGRSLLVAA